MYRTRSLVPHLDSLGRLGKLGRPGILPITFTCLIIWTLLWLHLGSIPAQSTHRITDADLSLTNLTRIEFLPDQPHHEYYQSKPAQEFCAAHGYTVFQPKSPSGERKIYDLFMVNSELDFLEIRLNTLYNYVDYFVIVESARTFQGNPKPMTIRDNWGKFKRFHDKLIYHEMVYPKDFKGARAWDNEDLQRNAMYDQVIPKLQGRQAAVEGDVLLVADVDEMPRPETLILLRTCNFPRRLTLTSKFYYYSFQFLHQGPEWPHPQATYYQGSRTILPANLRQGDGGNPLLRGLEMGTLENAAWHCSSCFATMGEFLNKMASFSHERMNHRYFQNRTRIATAVREGKDLWLRPKETFQKIENNEDVPKYILKEKDRFRYMLNRDGETAGFVDYP